MSHQHKIAFKVFIAILTSICLVVVLSLTIRHDRSKEASTPNITNESHCFIAPETYIFHGKGDPKETHVPFSLYGGTIEIMALINGKPMRCSVDTGSAEISWAAGLHLTSQRTGLQSSMSDAGGHSVYVQEAMLDSVQVGALELKHIRSYAITSGDPQSNPVPNLGNSVFAHTVLSVDYARHELVIQPPFSYNVFTGIRYPQNVLSFHWVSPDARGMFGVPCVHARVMTRSVNMIVDTGWHDPIGLSHNFYDRLVPQLEANHVKRHKAVACFPWGNSDIIVIDRLSSSFAGITLISPASAVDALSPGAQAVLGYGFLRVTRTTIDYPDKKIWFEGIPAKRKDH